MQADEGRFVTIMGSSFCDGEPTGGEWGDCQAAITSPREAELEYKYQVLDTDYLTYSVVASCNAQG